MASCLHFQRDYVPVADFYAEKSIFVTGGTGFMGKVLVEKLLRSCPKIKNIYLLMRPKKGQDVTSRLSELTQSPLFEMLRRDRPHELNKIVPIVGDITEPQLGISNADQDMLCREVSVVFHSAATVKFDEKLKLSVTINMLGTQQLVQLCHRMLALEALVHVSTAYCNCEKESVEEMVYPPPAHPEHVVTLVQTLPDELVDRITPDLVGDRPNTYTFTKALAEDMLIRECGNLPVAIVRPSIVLSSLKEPVKGWVDNWNGPNGIIAAVGKGLFRTMLGSGSRVADLVPVDTVINLMIVCAWRTHLKRPNGIIAAVGKGLFRTMLGSGSRVADLVPVDTVINLMIVCAWRTHLKRGEGVVVYNCCTGQQNPITWSHFVRTCFKYMRKHPFSDLFWYPDGDITSNRLKHSVLSLLQHRAPAAALDALATAAGRKPTMIRVQNKLEKASACLEYFTTRQWAFADGNVRELCASLAPRDRESFDFDVSAIDWDKYIESYVLGIRCFLFKESPETLPKSRRVLRSAFDFDVSAIDWDKYIESYVLGIRCFLFKESPDTLPKSRRVLRRLHIVHTLVQVTLALLAWRFLFRRSRALRAVWARVCAALWRLARLARLDRLARLLPHD